MAAHLMMASSRKPGAYCAKSASDKLDSDALDDA